MKNLLHVVCANIFSEVPAVDFQCDEYWNDFDWLFLGLFVPVAFRST